jgi:hypothetical protein
MAARRGPPIITAGVVNPIRPTAPPRAKSKKDQPTVKLLMISMTKPYKRGVGWVLR